MNRHGLAVVNCAAPAAADIVPGRVDAACGAAGFGFIKAAIAVAKEGTIDGVVTAPFHNDALRPAGVTYPGHTEIFTALTGVRRSCMMHYSEALVVSMVIIHIGYAQVPQRLSVARSLEVMELTAQALAAMRGRTPRLAVCGLNPHAGEHGLFGQREEEQWIEPVVAQARSQGLDVAGPLPPDTAFTDETRKRFDAVICLYHDQGHIPFKMLAFDEDVNIASGLPIVRTSVDHGTTFDIAWKGLARSASLFKAVACAVRLGAMGLPATPPQ